MWCRLTFGVFPKLDSIQSFYSPKIASSYCSVLAPVVQKVDSAIRRISHYS